MGRVRTKTLKKSSRQVIERYYSKMTLDFHTNKKILEEVALLCQIVYSAASAASNFTNCDLIYRTQSIFYG
uniref:Uncharacterized protein n=1 Tax=Salix viminalis TaxID=40686 RepID=A0A6N2MX93_SALVM